MSDKKKIMPKDIVAKWIAEVMTQSYTITIHPQECPFGEKFIRKLQKEGWDLSIIEDQKIVVSSNDPLKIAKLALRLRKRGYIIED
tara:strand:- start:141 stop:398 length:258 start_codon:yes stop_codon:yes gene_type:complete